MGECCCLFLETARVDMREQWPYSPEMNPDEYLNRDFKTVLRSSDQASSQKALLHKAMVFMDFLGKTPKRVMAYFKHSVVRYAT